jgi:hypothetical protein
LQTIKKKDDAPEQLSEPTRKPPHHKKAKEKTITEYRCHQSHLPSALMHGLICRYFQ